MELKNNYGDIVYLDSRFDIKKIKSLIKEGKQSEIDNYLSTIKGYPTHKEGGVDLTISKNGVSIKNGNTEFIAQHGLVLPNNFGNPLEFEAMSKVLSQRNKHLNWVDRGLNPDKYPKIDNQDGTFSTHRLAYSTGDNGEAYVYPTIIQNDKGELEQLDDKAAWEYAKKTNTAMRIPNVKLAEYYSKNGLIKHSEKESAMRKLGGYLAKGGPLGGDPKKRLTPISQNEVISGGLKTGYKVVQSIPTYIKMTDDQRKEQEFRADIDRLNKQSKELRLANAYTDQDRVDQQEQIVADWFARTPIPNSFSFFDDMPREEFFKFKELSSEEQDEYIRDWSLRQALIGRGSKNPKLNQLITSLIPAVGDIQELKFFDHTDPIDYAAYAAGFLLPGTPSFFKKAFKSDFARKLFKEVKKLNLPKKETNAGNMIKSGKNLIKPVSKVTGKTPVSKVVGKTDDVIKAESKILNKTDNVVNKVNRYLESPDPNNYYRVIGNKEGYDDLINSEMVRPNQSGIFKGRNTYYTKGKINDKFNPVIGGGAKKNTIYDGEYIVEIKPNNLHFPTDNHGLHKEWNFGLTTAGNEIPYSSEYLNVYKYNKKVKKYELLDKFLNKTD